MSFKTSLSVGKNKTKTTLGGAVGASLLMGLMAPANAQAIQPMGAAPVPAPPEAPVAQVAQPARAAAPSLDVQFEDIEISKLLQVIAENFDVEIVVADDVQGVIRSINLKNKTPQQAIQAVVTAGRLQYRLTDDGTYIIAKSFPDNPAQGIPAPANNNGFSQGFTPPITSTNNIWNNSGANAFSAAPTTDMGIAPRRTGIGIDPTDLAKIDDLPVLSTSRASSRRSTHAIRTRNVRAGIMAWWLDPANNEMPREFRQAQSNFDRAQDKHPAKLAVSQEDAAAMNGNQSTVIMPGLNGFNSNNPYVSRNSSSAEFNSSALVSPHYSSNAQFGGGGNRGGGAAGRGGAGGGGVFQLPDGVDRVVAIDPQNSLLVFGTDEGVRQLQDIIGILDRPLRQVEIEAQFVTVSTTDTRQFGIDYSAAKGNFNASTNGFASDPTTGSFSVGFVRGNFQATLSALLSSNRAKVITAPRVTAINNLTASLTSSTSTPVLLTSSTSNIGGNVGTAQNLLYITTNVGLTVTPTINNDDTVTVQMTPEVSSQSDSGLDVGAPIISQNVVDTIANVRDGDTIALGGLKVKNISRGGSKIPWVSDLPLVGKLFKSRRANDQESELIIFLTARIIRRYGDDDAVPGAD